MDTIAEDEEVERTPGSARVTSAKHPTQDARARFARTPGENERRSPGENDEQAPVEQEEAGATEDEETEPAALLEESTEVLITELKGADAEAPEADVLHVEDEEAETDSSPGSSQGDRELDFPPEDEEDGKWRRLNAAEEWDTDLEIEEEDLYAELHDTTGRTRYLRHCEAMGVVPCSYFMRHIQDPEIVMKFHGLGPSGTKALAKVLKDNINVEKLNLEGNWMESDGAKSMAKMLSENDYITTVNLAGNRLGSEGAEHMAGMLENNHTLKVISLAGNFFEDKDAECLSDAIEKNRNLQELSLADNKFGSEAGEYLGPAIGANDNIINLDLSWNQIRREGAAALAAGIKENVRLKQCNLSWNGFGSDGGCAVIDALLVNQSLAELDVSGNRLDDECARRMARVLAANDSLQVLKMGINPISTAGAITLIGAVLKNESSELKVLDLSEIPVEYEFVRIADELQRMRDFRVIHGPILRSGNTPDDIGKPAIDPTARHPLLVLKEHILVNDMRIVTALQKHDEDNKLCVSKDQFMQALDELDIKYWRSQIEDVAKKLDKYRNGTIYYGDFIPPEGPKREPGLDLMAMNDKKEAEP